MRTQPLPLTALRSFEAFARHLSIEMASEELNVTSSAVQHQIRSLEEFVGRKLVVYEKQNRRLTSCGQDLFESTNKGFSILRQALSDIKVADDSEAINVLICSTANHPHITETISKFISCSPAAQVNVSIGALEDSTDLASYSLIFSESGYHSQFFRSVVVHQESLMALCRSDYAKYLESGDSSRTLARILTVEGKDDERALVVAMLEQRGISRFNVISFANRRDAARAALEGIGIAMIDVKLYEDEIVEELLVKVQEDVPTIRKKYILSVKRTAEEQASTRSLMRSFGIAAVT